MRRCIVLRWGYSKIRVRSIGRSSHTRPASLSTTNLLSRFRDIGYQHIPYFNCPRSPKCKGCVTGRFTDGERFLFKEDCRPNWFKYVGMD